ncbi:MAG TPA: ion transporter [Methanoregula sp.]|nr:ion transporter [Methanoregula sp.]
MSDAEPCLKPNWNDKIQEKVYFLLECPANHNWARKLFIYFIATLILLNVIVVILETKHELFIEYASYFTIFDAFTVTVFSIEYALRVWVCVRNPKYSSPVTGRIRFALSPLVLVDLIAITPFYLPLIMPIEFRTLRLLRLLRIFRVLRLGRYSHAFETFADVLKSKKEELVITIIMAVIILTLASSALYAVEREAQPEKFASIPDAMWWAVVTLATVGYGDVYPITPLGKFITALVALSAIGLFALPAGILAGGFADSFHKRRTINKDTTLLCPHCGTEFTIHGNVVPDSSEKTGLPVNVAQESNNDENNSE